MDHRTEVRCQWKSLRLNQRCWVIKLAPDARRMLFIAFMSVLLFFIDGLGIGTRGPDNPLDALNDVEPLAVFQNEEPELIHDGRLVRTDACLGVEGRPQSASGQT